MKLNPSGVLVIQAMLLAAAAFGQSAGQNPAETAEAVVWVEAGEFFNIYNPADERHPWSINDHCFVYGRDGRWHFFGITDERPMDAPPSPHAEYLAYATASTLNQKPWQRESFPIKADPAIGEVHLWAPHIIEHDGLYYMYYCAGDPDHTKYKINLATSKDLRTWQRHPANPMVVDGYDARDPFILRVGDQWVMYYTATETPAGGHHTVEAVTSDDLIRWSNKRRVFTDAGAGTWGGDTESPFVVRRGEYYYLFIGPGDSYVTTKVFRSKDPFQWTQRQQAAVINAHAVEIVRDLNGDWYASHCGLERGGLYLAPLKWNDGLEDDDTSMPIPTKVDVPEVRLAVNVYRDKMMAGWLGQMVGVTWGFPTEFKYLGKMILETEVPAWTPEMINGAFGQDDLYVEMTFLKTLQDYGLNASARQAGIDFANSEYELWHANDAGRNNLRKGIAPPDSGHPQFNVHADDIDYQIEADFAGLISPAMPNQAVALGNTFGRIVNYGDGLYAGQFISAMYSIAFTESDLEKIVTAALAYIPTESQYAQAIRDTLTWFHQHPEDWTATWHRIDDKYQKNPDFRKFSCDKGQFNIDAKINGAYAVMGLLYGRGDIEKTITISMRCGQDSDCNPSTAAGILFTTLGLEKLPPQFKAYDATTKFVHTPYTLPELFEVCQSLAQATVLQCGGRVQADNGQLAWLIPVSSPRPNPLERSEAPGPIAGVRYDPEEIKHIKHFKVD